MADKLLEEFKQKIQAVERSLKQELAGLRSNRPTSALVENLKVSYLEQNILVKQLGSISIVPPREINIQVWDQGLVSAVIKAVEASGMGLSVSADGNRIRIFLPELSGERRQELSKKAKQITEDHRIRIRHLRDEYNKKIQQSFDRHEISEDQKFKLKEEIQKAVDKINNEMEESLKIKIKEIES